MYKKNRQLLIKQLHVISELILQKAVESDQKEKSWIIETMNTFNKYSDNKIHNAIKDCGIININKAISYEQSELNKSINDNDIDKYEELSNSIGHLLVAKRNNSYYVSKKYSNNNGYQVYRHLMKTDISYLMNIIDLRLKLNTNILFD